MTARLPESDESDTVVPVEIDSWEIECCAPLPTVGQPASWRLLFAPPAPEPEFNVRADWLVSPWMESSSTSRFLRLQRGDLTAVWRDPPDISPGIHRLTGRVYGSGHGGSDIDSLPPSTAQVRRVRVIRVMAYLVNRWITEIPGTVELIDVHQSPKVFLQLPNLDDSAGQTERGVLIDLAFYHPE
jgi:hypothetical protein